MRRTTLSLLAGVLAGALAFGGGAAFASGVIAERSTNTIYVDGQEVTLEAYTINGSNYVRLRDIGKAIGFNVYWDGSVQVDSNAPYTGWASRTQGKPASVGDSVQPAAATDYSAQANPAVFSGGYTREMYNALRHTILTKSDSQQFVLANDGTKQICWNVTAANSVWPGYELVSDSEGKAHFTLVYSDSYAPAAEYCQPFINSLAEKSGREKVKAIAFYVCDRLEYRADSTSTPRTALVDKGVHYGNCMSYAHNFKFLCDMAGIPCIFVHSSVHQWNQVYLEGAWWSVDVSGTDSGYTRTGDSQVLYKEGYLQGDIFRQAQPELTAFAKETLVPG